MLEESDADRIPGLIPVKYQRMAVSPFTFFRGAAIVQAPDLAKAPVSGIMVQACGDCHLATTRRFPQSPFPGIASIKAKATETIFTPKAGYRVVDSPKLQADALIGLRYWHIGENLSFQPSGLLSNYSQAANFVDVIAGAKISMGLSPKASVTVLGDAGAGQANVDYQVAAFLGYRVKPTVMLGAG
ncbi:DUF2252 family protein [Tunturiibacter gelidiferens]|uniref:DUF2252 family protein n=1 Tax=Tunturiibacter gelidiferens TaxID=3069689 RepID=UPI003D9BB97F